MRCFDYDALEQSSRGPPALQALLEDASEPEVPPAPRPTAAPRLRVPVPPAVRGGLLPADAAALHVDGSEVLPEAGDGHRLIM